MEIRGEADVAERREVCLDSCAELGDSAHGLGRFESRPTAVLV